MSDCIGVVECGCIRDSAPVGGGNCFWFVDRPGSETAGGLSDGKLHSPNSLLNPSSCYQNVSLLLYYRTKRRRGTGGAKKIRWSTSTGGLAGIIHPTISYLFSLTEYHFQRSGADQSTLTDNRHTFFACSHGKAKTI